MTRPRFLAVLLVVAVLVVVVVGTESGPSSLLEEKAEGATETRNSRGLSASTLLGMSPDTIAVGVFTVLGGLAALFGERYLRHRGALLFKSSGWTLICTLRTLRDYSEPEQIEHVAFDRTIPADERMMERAEYAAYSCDIKMFNEKEADTGLRHVAVVFVDDSGTELIRRVLTAVDSRNFAVDPDVLNLPARQWVYAQYRGVIQPEDFETLVRSTKVELRAYLPRDKPFVREISRLWE